MLFRMATPRRSKSGSIIVRKGVPKDVRAEYQRLYGPGWEAKLTVPAGTRPQDAKVRVSEWTAEVETRIATIRAAKGQSLTQSVATRRTQALPRTGTIFGSHSSTFWKTTRPTM
jgi:hypothetical protein